MLAEIFGPDLIIVIIIIAMVIFGGAAIPKLARSLGSAKTEFEKGLKEGQDAGAEKDANGSSAPQSPEQTPPSGS